MRNLRATETRGLPKKLVLKLTARYMVTNNVDTEDGLVNGADGILHRIDRAPNNPATPIIAWIDFGHNTNIGRKVSFPMFVCF